MVLVLKLASLAIWLIIMLFVSGAVIRRKIAPLNGSTLQRRHHIKSRAGAKSDPQQYG